VVLTSVKSQDQVKKETEENASKQKGIDESLIQDYLKKNNIKAFKTETGLYYTINQAGAGDKARAGQKITVNYTGKTMDGKVFDSNVDPQFSHVEPFIFTLGEGQVIKGWDEGLMLLNRGAKATLYIPSTLAYGDRGAGGAIGPNEVLIFDVEVIYIGDPAPKPIIIKDDKDPAKDDHKGHKHDDHDGHKH
jgi:FKBP-type peptidyl-prolyl cis-trans isomerase FkpA